MLISTVQQNNSVIHICIFFFIFFSIVNYHRILNIVPCALLVGSCYLSVLYITVCIFWHLSFCCLIFRKSLSPNIINHVFFLIYFSWRPITLQYCGGFCHTLTWISHGCTCVSHPEPPPTSLPIPSLWVIPVYQPWIPCLMHQTWTGDLFHSLTWMLII